MQFGEDKWLAERFKYWPLPAYAAEVGASDGVNLSNTYALELSGWNVVCIEPNPLYRPSLEASRELSILVACGAENLDDQDFTIYGTTYKDQHDRVSQHYMAGSSLRPNQKIVEGAKADLVFERPTCRIKVPVRTLDWCLHAAEFPRCDVVSIDTEGTELDVLRGFDFEKWRPLVMMIENNFEEDDTRSVMREHGYRMVIRLGVNDIWEKEK